MRVKIMGRKNIFEEIAEQYRQYILLGAIKEGEKLPSCRELAMTMGINPATVERAYALLEAEGLVVTVPKKGVFIKEPASEKGELMTLAKTQIAQLKKAGLTKEELIEIINSP